nr:hypothetical protein [Oceanococcus sp. HetDA_MAG_MS8]
MAERQRGKRRVHAYCVGAPKTGTHSVAGMFESCLKVQHEPTSKPLLRAIQESRRFPELKQDYRSWLYWRDKQDSWELESNHLLAAFTPTLVSLFPHAKFIITVRSPRAWLGSMLDDQLNAREWIQSQAPLWASVYHYYFSGFSRPCAGDEQPLENRGLFPLDGYLRFWAAHLNLVLEAIPESRRIVVCTSDLGESKGFLSAFLNIEEPKSRSDSNHLYATQKKHGLLDLIDPPYLHRKLVYWRDQLRPRLRRLLPEKILDLGG